MLETLNQVKSTAPLLIYEQLDLNIKPKVFNRVFSCSGIINSLIPGTASAYAWSKIEQIQG